ncbi:DUF4298 domain-containing protein [Peptoniphilus sp.]|jgi:hypothetical protein|uniref:DUF4298 domain-containing protein n=1 Tax=Peptoniphilus sp. TaxID=1971214 RepID=UPI003D907946
MEKNIDRVRKMEEILDDYSKTLSEFNESFKHLIEAQDRYEKLKDYYGSDDYFDDLESWDRGEFPKDLRCGVLSEDAVFNLMGDNFSTAIKMLEVATEMVKKH